MLIREHANLHDHTIIILENLHMYKKILKVCHSAYLVS